MPLIDGKQIRNASINGDTKLTSAFLATLIRTTGANAFTANQSLGGNKLTNVGAPTSSGDAANKYYVDSVATGLDVKESVRLGTVAALPACTASGNGIGKTLTANANGTLTIDGVQALHDDRILVKNQANPVNNGIYKVTNQGSGSTAWVLTRAIDFDQPAGNTSSSSSSYPEDALYAEVTAGAFTFVVEGTENVDTGWVLISNDPITVDASPMTFTQFTGAGAITAGAGLTKSGNTLDVNTADTSMTINADSIQVKRDPAGAITLDGGSAGIEVNVDGTSIEISSNALRIASGAAGSGLGYSAGVLSVNVATAGGLEIVTDELQIKVANTSVATSAAGLKAAVPSSSNKVMTASVTAADNAEACSTGISSTPSGDGYVEVNVNGVQVQVGDGTKVAVESYFSGDAGVTARAIAAIVATDKLYWNGTVAGYELATTDKIDFNYNVIV
jgi:hypothetical protein